MLSCRAAHSSSSIPPDTEDRKLPQILCFTAARRRPGISPNHPRAAKHQRSLLSRFVIKLSSDLQIKSFSEPCLIYFIIRYRYMNVVLAANIAKHTKVATLYTHALYSIYRGLYQQNFLFKYSYNS